MFIKGPILFYKAIVSRRVSNKTIKVGLTKLSRGLTLSAQLNLYLPPSYTSGSVKGKKLKDWAERSLSNQKPYLEGSRNHGIKAYQYLIYNYLEIIMLYKLFSYVKFHTQFQEQLTVFQIHFLITHQSARL